MGRVLNRDIFLSGEYVDHFCPEDKGNPFRELYLQKKRDVLELVEGSGKRIIDVGGGMGRIAVPLARTNRIVLCDISPTMLRLAQEEAAKRGVPKENIRFVCADARERLPFSDGYFDYVLCLDLLVHLPYPEDTLREFYRLLSNEGRLIIDSTNSNPLWVLFFPRYLGKNPWRWLKVFVHRGVLPEWRKVVTHYSKGDFFALLKKGGFLVEKEIDYGPSLCPKWHLVVAKKTR